MSLNSKEQQKVITTVNAYYKRNVGCLCRKCMKVQLYCPDTWNVQRVLRREKICIKCEAKKQHDRKHSPVPVGTKCDCINESGTCRIIKKFKSDPFHVDEIISIGRGGEVIEGNTQNLCQPCNTSKQDDVRCKLDHKRDTVFERFEQDQKNKATTLIRKN